MDSAPGAVGACRRNTKRQQAGEKKILHQASTSDHTPKKKTFQLQKGLIAVEDTWKLTDEKRNKHGASGHQVPEVSV